MMILGNMQKQLLITISQSMYSTVNIKYTEKGEEERMEKRDNEV